MHVSLVWIAVAAVLLFWAVGAWNRLMALRNEILRSFAAVERQLKARDALYERLVETLAPRWPGHADALSALQSACRQSQAALSHARAQRGASAALTSLRLAEAILAEARGRLPMLDRHDAAQAALAHDLDLSDGAILSACTHFNDAAHGYNVALHQFPTRLLAASFGFGAAGAL